MGRIFRALSSTGIGEFLRSRFYTIRQINKKYATPRIKTTRLVRISLFMLRIYLLVLVAILLYKFITLVVK
jgi:hypothetical protein